MQLQLIKSQLQVAHFFSVADRVGKKFAIDIVRRAQSQNQLIYCFAKTSRRLLFKRAAILGAARGYSSRLWLH